jgi:hypothetical protein
MSAFPILAKEKYVQRHDRKCAQLHFNVRKEIEVKFDNEHWYELVPKLVETSHEREVITLWYQHVQTDRTIPNNKPDIIMRHSERGTC